MSDAFSDPGVVNAAIAVTGTVLVALITSVFALVSSRGRRKTDVDGDAPAVAPSPLANFSGTQNEFMSLVIKDNQELRDQVTELGERMGSAERQLRETQTRHSDFQRAVRMYLEELATAWPGPAGMPWPNERDLQILEHTLPRIRRRQTSPT